MSINGWTLLNRVGSAASMVYDTMKEDLSAAWSGLVQQRKVIAALFIPAIIYLLIQSAYIGIPVVGIHSWDESSYIVPLDHMLTTGDPLSFYQRYDPQSPDYNDRYIYFWSAWLFLEAAQVLGFEVANDLTTYLRAFSIIATLISYVLVYIFISRFLSSEDGRAREVVPLMVAVFFLFSPLVLWFGGKAKIEPLGFALHLFVLLSILDYVRNGRQGSLYGAALLLGLMAVSRTPFLVLGGAYFAILLFYPRRMRVKSIVLSAALFLIGFLAPILLIDSVKPDVNALGFLINKLTLVSVDQAGSTPFNDHLISRLIKDSILTTIGIGALAVFGAFLVSRGRLLRELSLFSVPGFLYLALTYKHNIIHMYHSYYYLVPVLLSLGILLCYLDRRLGKVMWRKGMVKKEAHDTALRIMVIAVVLALILPGLILFVSFYGSPFDESPRGVYLKDGGGNADSVITGSIIKKVSEELELPSGYNLLPEPVTGFYSHQPFIGFTFYYKWNTSIREYDRSYDYFANPVEFTSAVRNESIIFIVTFKGVFENAEGDQFYSYLGENFALVDMVGAYSIYVNATLDVTTIRETWSAAKHSLTPEETRLPEALLRQRAGL